MLNLAKLFERAKSSSFYLWLLNFGLNRKIPFNRPHGFRIVELTNDAIVSKLSFKTRNLNHIHSLHACALATVSEFSTGVFLLSKLDPLKYRLILKELRMEYHFQGKSDSLCHFGLTNTEIEEKIIIPLKSNDSVEITCNPKTFDVQGNHLSTGWVTWQIKDWSKVKTKV